MKVLPECVVNFAQLRRVSQLGQVTSKHQSGLTWGPPPSPWPLSKFFINFFPNYTPKHSFALHDIGFPHSFIQRQIPLFLDTLQWPLSNSCHPSPVKYVLISFGKAFPRMTRPSNQLRIIFFQIWHRAQGAIMIMQKEKRNQAFCALTTGISQSIWFAQ